MNNKKENRGGPRANAGRKKLSPGKRKMAITVFIEAETVESVGGDDAAKVLITNALYDAVKIV